MVDKEIFKRKLDGTFNDVVAQAFMYGFVKGHQFGQQMGVANAGDIQDALDEFLEKVNKEVQ